MTLGILIAIITLTIDVITDLKQWGRVNHLRGALLRCIGLIPAAWLLWPHSYLLLSYWPIFDTCIAIGRNLPWYYTGTTSWLDKLQARYQWLKVVKYLIIPITIIICLLTANS